MVFPIYRYCGKYEDVIYAVHIQFWGLPGLYLVCLYGQVRICNVGGVGWCGGETSRWEATEGGPLYLDHYASKDRHTFRQYIIKERNMVSCFKYSKEIKKH